MPELNLNPLIRPCVKCGAADRYKDGKCKPCAKAGAKSQYAANPDRAKSVVAAYRAANPNKVKTGKAAWSAANPDKVRARKSAWAASNPDKVKARGVAYRAANPEKEKARNAAWSAANPDALRIKSQNRRAKKRANGGKLSKSIAAKLFKLQRGLCPCCKQPLGEDFNLDHITPLALGGPNIDNNIQLLRRKCNRQKSFKDPIEFMQQRGFLI